MTSSGKSRHERQYKGDAVHGTAGPNWENTLSNAFVWYVGIDWGWEEHIFCVLDSQGEVRGTRKVAHTAVAVYEAVAWLLDQTAAKPETVAVGLETPRGVLVDSFLERGFPVFALNPKQLDRFRDRFTAAGAKDDRRDARAVADGLRTDLRAFRRLQPEDPLVIQLREWSRLLEELQQQEQRLANRLRDQLFRVNAPWLTLSPAANEPWLWTVLADTTHPDAWTRLSRRRITSALRAHRIRRLTVDDVLAVLRQPRLHVAAGVADAVEARIASLVPQLRLVHDQLTKAERRIDHLLVAMAEATDEASPEHRDVAILQSLPGVGRSVAATMLTEATGPLADRDYGTLRAHTGAAPVTKRSGKRAFLVHMRYACHRRLRSALFHWARTSIQGDAAARAYYDALRARGHRHARALRSVADRWLRILVAMLRTRTLYDPSRFPQTASTAA
jgi:transposase